MSFSQIVLLTILRKIFKSIYNKHKKLNSLISIFLNFYIFSQIKTDESE